MDSDSQTAKPPPGSLDQVVRPLAELEAPDRCWCGVERPYYAPLPARCGGSGTIDCHCGGDQCVCHWHGEVECIGCEDCQGGDNYDED